MLLRHRSSKMHPWSGNKLFLLNLRFRPLCSSDVNHRDAHFWFAAHFSFVVLFSYGIRQNGVRSTCRTHQQQHFFRTLYSCKIHTQKVTRRFQTSGPMVRDAFVCLTHFWRRLRLCRRYWGAIPKNPGRRPWITASSVKRLYLPSL